MCSFSTFINQLGLQALLFSEDSHQLKTQHCQFLLQIGAQFQKKKEKEKKLLFTTSHSFFLLFPGMKFEGYGIMVVNSYEYFKSTYTFPFRTLSASPLLFLFKIFLHHGNLRSEYVPIRKLHFSFSLAQEFLSIYPCIVLL